MNAKQRRKNRATAKALHRPIADNSVCPECGEPGAHWIQMPITLEELLFAPQGVPNGFWTCDKFYGPDGRRIQTRTSTDYWSHERGVEVLSFERFEIAEYMAAGCFQVERGPSFRLGVALHAITGGRICDGCPEFREGRCPPYKELTRSLVQKKRDLLTPTETVKEEAARLGISISEVRRRRNAPTHEILT